MHSEKQDTFKNIPILAKSYNEDNINNNNYNSLWKSLTYKIDYDLFIRILILFINIIGICLMLFMIKIRKNSPEIPILKEIKSKIIFKIYLDTSLKDIKACICMVVKNENLYIKEYVNYYKKLGVDKIFIYDNNDKNGEKLEDVLQDDINKGYVNIKNIRGVKKRRGIQLPSYIDCYKKYWMEYDWLLYFDADEFLYFKNKTLKEFLFEAHFNKCQSILINWLEYGDNDILYYDNRSVFSKFTKGTPSTCIKSIIKGRTNPIKNIKFTHVHYLDKQLYACNTTGYRVNSNYSLFNQNISEVHLKHFYTKSTEEFIKKIQRGIATTGIKNYKHKANLKFKLKKYFIRCKKTPEKIKMFEKAFHIKLKKIIT